MAGSVNKVMLIGHLGKDPETRSFQNGGKMVSFSIATSESWKDKNSGERQERTQWHNIVIFNEQLGGVAERFLKKGSKVYIEGQLETRKWQDKDGNDKYTTEVVLRPYRGEITMLDGRNGSGQDGGGGQNGQSNGRSSASGGSAKAQQPYDEDEIPF